MIELEYNTNIRYPDQDAINIVASGYKIFIPANWNCIWHILWVPMISKDFLNYREYIKRIIPTADIIHYCGSKKPWNTHKKEVDSSAYKKFWDYCDDPEYRKTLKNIYKSNHIRTHNTKHFLTR